MMEHYQFRESIMQPAPPTLDADYLKGLLGVDQWKKLSSFAQKLKEQIERENINPNEIFEHLSVISDVHVKLSNLENHQLETLGKLVGWIHNITFVISMLHQLKLFISAFAVEDEGIKKLKNDLNTALIEQAKLLFRIVNLYVFWLGILMSKRAHAFDKLTSRTMIQHSYAQNVDKEKRRWWWI